MKRSYIHHTHFAPITGGDKHMVAIGANTKWERDNKVSTINEHKCITTLKLKLSHISYTVFGTSCVFSV